MITKTKVCKKCGLEKPLTDFYKDLTVVDKLTSTCKSCKIEYAKQWNKRFGKRNQHKK